MGEDLGIPDVAKTVAWAGDSLCVGFKRDYYLIKVCIYAYFKLWWPFLVADIKQQRCQEIDSLPRQQNRIWSLEKMTIVKINFISNIIYCFRLQQVNLKIFLILARTLNQVYLF